MKAKVNSFLIVSITMILISLILISSGLSKPKLKGDFITFIGDLEGSQEVFGCCPNAGPYPDYSMKLSTMFPDPMPEEHDGKIFINYFGAGKERSYIVQFWWTEGGIMYFIEIIGGIIENNRKMKILTVSFDNAPCKILIDNELTETIKVNFILTREEL